MPISLQAAPVLLQPDSFGGGRLPVSAGTVQSRKSRKARPTSVLPTRQPDIGLKRNVPAALRARPSPLSYSGHSIFDERHQPGQRLIPLLGNEIEVFLNSFHRPGIEFESALATRTDAVHNSYTLQHSKMLGDRLPGQPRTLR